MTSPVDHRSFVNLLLASQPRLYSYIRALIPDRVAADDVYQNACVVLWEKFAEFRPNTSFIHWALQVARYEVLAYRRDQARDRLVLTPEVLDIVEAEAMADPDSMDDTRAALEHCLAKLSTASRRLLMQRYEPNASVTTMASDAGCPVATLYTRLKRIRGKLFRCVQAQLQG